MNCSQLLTIDTWSVPVYCKYAAKGRQAKAQLRSKFADKRLQI